MYRKSQNLYMRALSCIENRVLACTDEKIKQRII